MSGFRILLLFFLTLFQTQASKGQNCLTTNSSLERGKQLYHSEQFLLSAIHFSMAMSSDCPDLANEARWYFALSMHGLGETQEAFATLSILEQTDSFQRSARLFKSYLLRDPVHGLAHNDLYRLKLWEARNHTSRFQNLLQESPFLNVQNIVLKDLQLRFENSHVKNPWIAGISSAIIPGSGQAYVGTWQSASIALVFNLLFLGTTIELANHNLKFATITSGLIFSITYIGNIINAVSAANQYNQNVLAFSEDALRKQLFPEFKF